MICAFIEERLCCVNQSRRHLQNIVQYYASSPKKLKRNGPSTNANAPAETADKIAAPETTTNAEGRIIDDHLFDVIERTSTLGGMSNKLTLRILGFLGYLQRYHARKLVLRQGLHTMVPIPPKMSVNQAKSHKSRLNPREIPYVVVGVVKRCTVNELYIYDLVRTMIHG